MIWLLLSVWPLCKLWREELKHHRKNCDNAGKFNRHSELGLVLWKCWGKPLGQLQPQDEWRMAEISALLPPIPHGFWTSSSCMTWESYLVMVHRCAKVKERAWFLEGDANGIPTLRTWKMLAGVMWNCTMILRFEEETHEPGFSGSLLLNHRIMHPKSSSGPR